MVCFTKPITKIQFIVLQRLGLNLNHKQIKLVQELFLKRTDTVIVICYTETSYYDYYLTNNYLCFNNSTLLPFPTAIPGTGGALAQQKAQQPAKLAVAEGGEADDDLQARLDNLRRE